MNQLSTEVKKQKLNIFQKIRLNLYRRNANMTFEQFSKAPDYVRRDGTVLYHLKENNDLSLEEFLQLPAGILQLKKSDIQKFPLSEQTELVKKGYVSKYQFSNEEKNAFMMEDIVNLGNYETFSEWGLEHTRYARVSSIFKGKQ